MHNHCSTIPAVPKVIRTMITFVRTFGRGAPLAGLITFGQTPEKRTFLQRLDARCATFHRTRKTESPLALAGHFCASSAGEYRHELFTETGAES
jgi:hypothetical protein